MQLTSKLKYLTVGTKIFVGEHFFTEINSTENFSQYKAKFGNLTANIFVDENFSQRVISANFRDILVFYKYCTGNR